MTVNRKVHILGGGTHFHIRPHLALSAPAYGTAAKLLASACEMRFEDKMDIQLHLTRMAGGPAALDTNADVEALLDQLIADPLTKIIFMNVALCDFEAHLLRDDEDTVRAASEAVGDFEEEFPSIGKAAPRLKTSDGSQGLLLTVADKLIQKIRAKRKDIFLVGTKTTAGATQHEQYLAGLNLLKAASCNLVLANDIHTRSNMIITPEEAKYHVTQERSEVLTQLVDMVWHRSHLTFTQSTVVDGTPVPWMDPRIPPALRKVVNHCIARGAYKPFRGATVGHFAAKVDDNLFLTSIRKTNFNDLEKNGLVLVKTSGPDTVLAYGAKPSVGGQSQRALFGDHPGYDCIVHFHCPLKPGSKIPVVSQREFECGSHECGRNTSNGLAEFQRKFSVERGAVERTIRFYAVMLDQHGPNLLFSKNAELEGANAIIDFIEENFDLENKTGGLVSG